MFIFLAFLRFLFLHPPPFLKVSNHPWELVAHVTKVDGGGVGYVRLACPWNPSIRHHCVFVSGTNLPGQVHKSVQGSSQI